MKVIVEAVEAAFKHNPPKYGTLQVVITYHDGKPCKVEYSRTDKIRGDEQGAEK